MLAPDKPVSTASVRRAPAHIPALDGIRGAAPRLCSFSLWWRCTLLQFCISFRGRGHSSGLGWSLSFFCSIRLPDRAESSWIHLSAPNGGKRSTYAAPYASFPCITPHCWGECLFKCYCECLGLPSPRLAIFFYLQDIPGLVRFEILSPLFALGHFWSLAVEEQFYLVWPFLLFLANRRGRVRQLCLGIYLLSLIFRISVFSLHPNWQWAGYFIGGRAGEMAEGDSWLRHFAVRTWRDAGFFAVRHPCCLDRSSLSWQLSFRPKRLGPATPGSEPLVSPS